MDYINQNISFAKIKIAKVVINPMQIDTHKHKTKY